MKLTHLPKFRPLADTFTAYADDFLSCVSPLVLEFDPATISAVPSKPNETKDYGV